MTTPGIAGTGAARPGAPEAQDLSALVPELLPRSSGLYWDGRWHDAEAGRTLQSINPSTGQLLSEVAQADDAAVVAAVGAAAPCINPGQGNACTTAMAAMKPPVGGR